LVPSVPSIFVGDMGGHAFKRKSSPPRLQTYAMSSAIRPMDARVDLLKLGQARGDVLA
jgi:hypothetical protein